MVAPVRVSFRLSPQEFMRACEANWQAQGVGSKANLITGLLGIAAGCVMWFFGPWWLAAGMVVVGGFLSAMMLVRRVIWRQAYRDARKYMGEIAVEFTEHAIHVESEEGVSDLNWGFFTWYLITPAFVLLYLTKRSFSTIPRRAFLDETSEATFLSLVTSRLSPVQSKSHDKKSPTEARDASSL